MKKGLKYAAKGIIGILCFKVLTVIILFTISSCKKDNKKEEISESQKKSLLAFTNQIKSNSENIKGFYNRHKTEIEALKNKELSNVLQNGRDISIADSIDFILYPTVTKATNILIEFGATNQDIIDSLGSLTDSRQITAAMAILQRNENYLTPLEISFSNEFQSLFLNQANAKPKWIECLGEALGLTFFANVSHLFQNGVQGGIKKILGEVAKRYLGPASVIGVVATYAWCMW